MRPRRAPPISAARQYFALSSSSIFPGQGGLEKGRLVWQFSAKPTALSREYQLRILFRQGSPPQIFVTDPDLTELADGKDLPHVYQQKPPQLCLYLPGTGEWAPDQWIHKTIIPWAVLWLFFFENWLATGEWQGGGKHPEVRNEKHKKNSLD